jgi:hypothetical protein
MGAWHQDWLADWLSVRNVTSTYYEKSSRNTKARKSIISSHRNRGYVPPQRMIFNKIWVQLCGEGRISRYTIGRVARAFGSNANRGKRTLTFCFRFVAYYIRLKSNIKSFLKNAEKMASDKTLYCIADSCTFNILLYCVGRMKRNARINISIVLCRAAASQIWVSL